MNLGTGEIEILKRIAEDPGHVLELRPGGLWTTPSTGIFVTGQPRWWATAGALNELRKRGMLRFRVGPKPEGSSTLPELELTPYGRQAMSSLGLEVS